MRFDLRFLGDIPLTQFSRQLDQNLYGLLNAVLPVISRVIFTPFFILVLATSHLSPNGNEVQRYLAIVLQITDVDKCTGRLYTDHIWRPNVAQITYRVGAIRCRDYLEILALFGLLDTHPDTHRRSQHVIADIVIS